MRYLFSIAILIGFAPLLHAVGSIEVENIETLTDQGFSFEVVTGDTDGKTVSISFKIPEKFHFKGAMGTKPFQGVSLYESAENVTSEERFIGITGTRFDLAVKKKKEKFSGSFSLIANVAKNKYLLFHFNQGPGYPPMIIHVPLPLLIAQLEKPIDE